MDVQQLSNRDLITLHRESLLELHERGVVRTFNPPQGDYAELLVARAFDGERLGSSAKGYDVEAGSMKIQVKSCASKSRQLSAIRSGDFTHLVIVMFSHEDLSVESATQLTLKQTLEVGRDDSYVNAKTVSATRRLLKIGEDLTQRVQRAAEEIGSERHL